MHRECLTIEEILSKIDRGITFEADSSDHALYIRIEDYTPYLCFAIHSGHTLNDASKENCLLSEFERWQEEDPLTDQFVSSLPVLVYAIDSRYEYDLNRNPEEAIYKEAWGKQVWKNEPTARQTEQSLQKHKNFYLVVDTLIKRTIKTFKACVLYDIHSYNYQRYSSSTPLFNIGIKNIHLSAYKDCVNHWKNQLSKISLSGIENVSTFNSIFEGNGYFLKYFTQKYPQCLVLATEIKKVYCNESNGEIFPLIVDELKEQLKNAILRNAMYFCKKKCNLNVNGKYHLLSKELDQEIIDLDKKLYNLVRYFEILNYVNPVNTESEKKKFFQSAFKKDPVFKYKQLNINPFHFKRALYRLPLEQIKDISIQHLYRDVIDAYADKTDIITSLGKEKFLYNNLRYYGKPDEKDIANANFLIYAPEFEEEKEENISSETAMVHFKNAIKEYGFNCNIAFSNKIISKALVINHKKTLLIKKNARFSELSMHALINHEVGVHLVTTMNARLQPLKIMEIGLPLNDHTQEGLAIFSEFRSANLSIARLKEIALRVIICDLFVKENSFVRTFEYLMDSHPMDKEKAFYLCARIFRGGGFTKDHLYLKGFKDILHYKARGHSLKPLLVGKTSLAYVEIIQEMIERKFLVPPKYINPVFQKQMLNNHIIDYLIKGLK